MMHLIILLITGLVLYLSGRFFLRALRGEEIEGISFPPDVFKRILPRDVYNRLFGFFYAVLLLIAGLYSLYTYMVMIYDYLNK